MTYLCVLSKCESHLVVVIVILCSLLRYPCQLPKKTDAREEKGWKRCHSDIILVGVCECDRCQELYQMGHVSINMLDNVYLKI